MSAAAREREAYPSARPPLAASGQPRRCLKMCKRRWAFAHLKHSFLYTITPAARPPAAHAAAGCRRCRAGLRSAPPLPPFPPVLICCVAARVRKAVHTPGAAPAAPRACVPNARTRAFEVTEFCIRICAGFHPPFQPPPCRPRARRPRPRCITRVHTRTCAHARTPHHNRM